MKFRFVPILFFAMAFVFLWQMTKGVYCQDSAFKSSIETPWEEAGDEDAKDKDTDNEEDDKTFYTWQEHVANSFVRLSHITTYSKNGTEQIREIIPPPPKA